MGLLDFLFPKYCVGCRTWGEYICVTCFAKISFFQKDICLVCNRQAVEGATHPCCRGRYTIDGAVASLVYAGIVKRLIYQFKYRPNLTDLQHVLLDFLYEGIIQKEQMMRILPHAGFFIPIPLHKDKLRQRGYNQAMLLSKGLSQRFGMPVLDALIRQKKTDSQYQLNREQRKKNLEDAFALNTRFSALIRDKTIILVDDVSTTGTTLLEAAKVLKKEGVKVVWGIALAHGT